MLQQVRELRAAVRELTAADKALNAYGDECRAAGIDWETPEYHRLNAAANAAAAEVPWLLGGVKPMFARLHWLCQHCHTWNSRRTERRCFGCYAPQKEGVHRYTCAIHDRGVCDGHC